MDCRYNKLSFTRSEMNIEEGITVLSLFDGISAGNIALKRAGIKVKNYYASEIDPWGMVITQQHFPNTIQIGDVSKVRYENGTLYTERGEFNVGKIDLVCGGSPCQSFSLAGKCEGMVTDTNYEIKDLETYLDLKSKGTVFKGYSYLFWEYMRILKETNPRYFLLENVKMKKHWQDLISNMIGVEPVAINSSLVSAQNRPRLYWSNLSPDKIEDRKIVVKDILTNFPKRCYHWLKPAQLLKFHNHEYKYISMYRLVPLDGKTSCVMTCMHNSSDNKIQVGTEIRHLNNEENELLQTLDYGYTSGIPESRRHHAIGNGWTVDIIVEFFKKIKSNDEHLELFTKEEMKG